MAKARDMTRGSPARLLAGFALPLMLGHVFQQIYNVADSAIVGRLISIDAFAAVGAAGFLSWLVTSAILGLTQGFGTVFAQRFGAGDIAGLRKSVGVGVGCALGVSVALTALGMALAALALPAMDTPPELLADAQLYLYVLFGGTPLLMGYNFAAAVLRALGDSKSPVYAGILSSLLNIALDYAAVAFLGMGVAGVALGTVLAQGFSLLFCLWRLRGVAQVRPGREDLRMDGAVARQLFALGGPMALRDGLMAIGGLIYQRVINGYGAVTVAGVAAAWRYFALMEVVGAGLDGAVAVYVGQNHGAGRRDRVRQGIRVGRRMALGGAVGIALLMAGSGRGLIALLVAGEAGEVAAVVSVGYGAMLGMALFLPALYLLYIHRAALQGMGDALWPMGAGLLELALRVGAVLTLPAFLGRWGVYLADGVGWLGAALLLTLALARALRREEVQR